MYRVHMYIGNNMTAASINREAKIKTETNARF